MARKGQVSIQDTLETNEDFEEYLKQHFNILICLEVYCEYCGYCLATGNAVRKGKLEIGQDRIAMAKALADKIDALARFRGKSEPVFLFIMQWKTSALNIDIQKEKIRYQYIENGTTKLSESYKIYFSLRQKSNLFGRAHEQGKLTRAMFGSNGIELCRVIEEELGRMKRSIETGVEIHKIEISAMLPEEAIRLEVEMQAEEEVMEAAERLRVLTLAARKKRVTERMGKELRVCNFILFWPHCHQAHYDLYEKWDTINISVAGKETIQMNEHKCKEALYMSDIDPNEACLHALMNGEALVVLFKMSDTDDRNIIKLMRHALYEEIPIPKEDDPPEKQLPPLPAYVRYSTISKTAREVRRDRYEAKLRKLREEKEEAERLAAEQARLGRQAQEEREAAEKQRLEEERFARIQAGLPADPEPEELGEEEGDVVPEELEVTEAEQVVEEEKVEEVTEIEEEFNSDVEVEGEDYIPPGGLFVPGFYTPANIMSKANGLVQFFPKVVGAITKIETEFLPQHVLVMFSADKRHDVKEVVEQYRDEILNLGIFVGEDPTSAEHVAYSIKQYDKMDRPRRHKDRLAVMVSRKRSLPLLQLAGLNPCYISGDATSGERDCLAMFPVGYGDDFEEEESVVEEEIVEVVMLEPDVTEEVAEDEPKSPGEEDEDED